MQDVGSGDGAGFSSSLLDEKKELVTELLACADALSETIGGWPEDDLARAASYAHEAIKPAMQAARDVADRLEDLVDAGLWPIPTYSDLIYNQ